VLAEIQTRLRDALVSGSNSDVLSSFAGGFAAAPRWRIHQRHYEASLVAALLAKFPATQWLVGTAFIAEAATRFVKQHPPSAPCIAEYGHEFPDFLAANPLARQTPYLRSFSELELHIGQTSIAIDLEPVPITSLAAIDPNSIPALRFGLQPGTRYFRAGWPLDELLKHYLTGDAPDRLVLTPGDLFLEIRGARGEFQFSRLGPDEFTFRQILCRGETVGLAAECALDVNSQFDIGASFGRLFAMSAVTSIIPPQESTT